MIPRSPDGAPPRGDLPYLTHRTLRRRPAGAPAISAESAVADFISGRGSRPGGEPAAPAAAPAPTRSSGSSLDLSAATPAPPRQAAPPPAAPSPGSSLDLSGRPAPPPAAPSSGSSLDLSARAAAAPPTIQPPAPSPARPARAVPRVGPGERAILTRTDPTVTLNRVQSGLGTLRIEAICSPAVGDVRLGAAYQLTDRSSLIVQRASGIVTAPPNSRRPVIAAGPGDYERLVIDLRQSRTLARMAVYVYSDAARPLTWGGTLVCTTLGGERVEVSLDQLGAAASQAVVLSLYNVDGEYVLRAELEPVAGDIREACRAFGFDRITWADARTPVA